MWVKLILNLIKIILDEIWNVGLSEESKAKKDIRKIIVFFTDEASHYALDGSLGGLLTPAGILYFTYNLLMYKNI